MSYDVLQTRDVKLKLFRNWFLNFRNRLLTDDGIDSRQSWVAWAGGNTLYILVLLA